MKQKNYWLTMLMICLVIMLTFTGCGSSNKSASSQSKDGYNEMSKEEPRIDDAVTEEYPDVTSGKFELPSTEKFIVRTGLTVETKTFDESVKKIEKMTADLKGYIESVEANYGTTYDRNRNRAVSYMLRIPKGSTLTAVNTIKSEVGLVVDERMTTENVTKRIRDTKRDIELLKAKEDRLIDLSKRTEDIESLIRIETELAEIISMREANQAALQNLEYDVQYDFLSIYLKEVRETKVVEENNFIGDVKTAFRDSIDGMVSFFQGLVILLVRFWFTFLMMILIVLIIILLIKRAEKRAAKRRLERGMNPAPHGYSMPYSPENLNGNANQTEEQKPNENKE